MLYQAGTEGSGETRRAELQCRVGSRRLCPCTPSGVGAEGVLSGQCMGQLVWLWGTCWEAALPWGNVPLKSSSLRRL